MKKKITLLLVIIGVVTLNLSLILFFKNQTPFPDVIVKRYSSHDVIESEVIQNEKYRIYVSVTQEQLISCYFEKELFWRNTLIKYKKHSDVITLGNYENNWDDYAVVYGSCNDSAIKLVEFVMKDGTVYSTSTTDKKIFWINVRWEDVVELKALDADKKLFYQIKK